MKSKVAIKELEDRFEFTIESGKTFIGFQCKKPVSFESLFYKVNRAKNLLGKNK